MIAHRLSTILAADRIVLMQDGAVVDTGAHEQLMADCAPHRALVAGQFDGDGPGVA